MRLYVPPRDEEIDAVEPALPPEPAPPLARYRIPRDLPRYRELLEIAATVDDVFAREGGASAIWEPGHGARQTEAGRRYEELQESIAVELARFNFPNQGELQALAIDDIMGRHPARSEEKASVLYALQVNELRTRLLALSEPSGEEGRALRSAGAPSEAHALCSLMGQVLDRLPTALGFCVTAADTIEAAKRGVSQSAAALRLGLALREYAPEAERALLAAVPLIAAGVFNEGFASAVEKVHSFTSPHLGRATSAIATGDHRTLVRSGGVKLFYEPIELIDIRLL